MQESKPIFELYLLHGQIRYRLDLPAEELQLDMTKRSLGIEDFAQAAIYQTRCEMEPLAGLLPMDCVSVESANELARTLDVQCSHFIPLICIIFFISLFLLFKIINSLSIENYTY